jgi:hypothetical protein
MLYGILMISETQGVGKGTLGERVLAPLVGVPNASFPSEKEIVDSNYNYWLAHKRLAVVHEIYAGHSSKAYNSLKSIITDRYITVSKKYQANYDIENWVHVYACSNSMRALQLTMDDRRWFVPKVSEKKRPAKYWADFNKWLVEDGGLQIIKGWASDFVERVGPVQRGDDAPWSELKRDIVEEGYSQGMTLVARTLERLMKIAEGDEPETRSRLEAARQLRGDEMFIIDEDLVDMIRNKLYDGKNTERLEKPITLRKLAKIKGWTIGDARVRANGKETRRASGKRLIYSTKDLSAKSADELFGGRVPAEDRLNPIDLSAFIEF